MLHNLLVCFNVLLQHSTASIVSSCDSFVHCLSTFIVGVMVAFVGLHMGSNLGGMFSWLVLGCQSIVIPLHLLWSTCNIMDFPFLLALTFSWQVDNTLPLLKVYFNFSWNLPKKTNKLLGFDIFKLYAILIW
jgi:hypothetical protein